MYISKETRLNMYETKLLIRSYIMLCLRNYSPIFSEFQVKNLLRNKSNGLFGPYIHQHVVRNVLSKL